MSAFRHRALCHAQPVVVDQLAEVLAQTAMATAEQPICLTVAMQIPRSALRLHSVRVRLVSHCEEAI